MALLGPHAKLLSSFYQDISFYVLYTIVFNLLAYQWEVKPSAFVADYAIFLFALRPFITGIPIIKAIPRMVLSLLIPSTRKNFIICEQWPLKIIKGNWKWMTWNQNAEGNEMVHDQLAMKGPNTHGGLAPMRSKKQVKNMQKNVGVQIIILYV